ncbi:MAG: sulfotransferase [Caulobacterales bacterium]
MTELLEMNEAAFLHAASAANGGLTDFGGDEFREPLRVLLKSLDEEAQMLPQALFGVQQRILQLLGLRLGMADLFKKHPEILDEPIERPLIILGLQRTGTTKLQNVLACDERWHTPFMWEALFPVPFPGEQKGDPSPRIAAARQWTEMFYSAMPEAMAGHAMVADQTEEETFAVELAFRWTVPAIYGMIPSYIKWVEEHSCVPTYQDLKRTLQALQWQRGSRKPWLLKAPWHIGFLDSLLKVFPDATIVQCNRDPFESVPSNCALMYLGRRGGRPDLDKKVHGADVLAMMGREMTMHLKQRDALGAKDPTIDVPYKHIVKDSVGVARRIYAARGEAPLSTEAEQAIRDWEANNVQHKYGKWEYTAEEYGVTRENLAEAFAEYYKRKALFE